MSRTLNIRTSLLLLVVAIVTPFLGLIAYDAWRDQQHARDTAQSEALQQARDVSARLDDQIEAVEVVINALALNLPINFDDPTVNDVLLAGIKAALPEYFNNLIVVLPDGNNFGTALPPGDDRARLNVADRDYFQAALTSPDLVVGRLARSRANGVLIVPFARAVFDHEGRRTAVIAASIRPDRLQTLLDPESLPPDSVISVIAQDGTVLAWSVDPERWAGTDVGDSEVLRLARRRREGAGEIRFADGVSRLSGFVTSRHAPWVIHVGIPDSAAFAPARAGLVRDGVLGALTLVLALAGAWLLSSRIARPLRGVAVAATALTGGRDDTRAPLHGNQEVRDVASALNQLADSTAARLTDLRALTSFLSVVNAGATLDEVARAGVDAAVEALSCDLASVMLVEEDGRLQPRALHGFQMEALALTPNLPLSSTAAREDRPVAYRRGLDDIGIDRFAEHVGLRGAVAVPCHAEGRVVAVLTVGSHTIAEFDPRGLRVLGALADGIGVAVARTDLQERERAAARQVQAFNAITDATLAHAGDADAVLQALVERVAAVLDAQVVAVRLLDPTDGKLRIRAAVNNPIDSWEERTVAPGEGLSGRAFLEGRPLYVEDVQSQQSDVHSTVRNLGTRSMLSVPMRAGGTVIGVLNVHARTIRRFSDEEVRLLEVAAERAAAVAEQARLHRRTEEALVVAEAERAAAAAERDTLQQVLNAMPQAIVIANRRGEIIAQNAALTDIVGTPAPRSGLEVFRDFNLRDADGRPLAPIDLPGVRAASTGQVVRAEQLTIFSRERGRDIPLLTNAAPIHDATGRITGVVFSFQDITRLKQAEDALRFLSEASAALTASLDYETTLARVARLALPFLADRCIVDLLDDAGQIRRVVVACADPVLEARAQELHRFVPDPASPQGSAMVLRTGTPLLHTEVTEADLPAIARGEEHRRLLEELGLASFMIVPLIARGRTLGALSFARTDPARRYTEADLATAEEIARRAALAVDNARLYAEAQATATRERRHADQLRGLAQASLAIATARTVEEMLSVVTEQARAVIGAHQAVASLTVDADWSQALTTVSLSDTYAAWRDFHAAPDGAGIYRLVCRDNQPMRLTQAELEAHPAWRGFGAVAGQHPPMRGLLAAPLMGGDGTNLGVVQLSDRFQGDFTEEDETVLMQLAQVAAVAIENARLQQHAATAAAALEADQLKTELLNTVSHELRTPLAAIKGFTTTLLLYFERLPHDEQMSFLHEIDEAADRLQELVDNLLNLSRLESGTLRLELQPAHIEDVLHRAVESARSLHPERVIDLDIPEELPVVHADARRIGQVVANLLDNAIKYSPGGEEVSVSAHPTGDGGLSFCVRDHGVGIPAEHLDHIFERFYRVDTRMTREIGGTGLGLAICHRIVTEHGGAITVSSVEGQGSTFTVTLH